MKKQGRRHLIIRRLMAIALLGAWIIPAMPTTLAVAAATTVPNTSKTAVVVLLDGLRQSDISQTGTPNLWRMQELGASGVMNENTLGSKTEANAYLTLGAGTKAQAPFQQVPAYEAQEKVTDAGVIVTGRDLYVRDTGVEPTGAVLLPQLPQVEQQATKAQYTIQPGLLGRAVHELGGQTAVLGNADLGTLANRPAVLLAMNEQGQVDLGSLQVGTVTDPNRPFGMRTDMTALYRAYQRMRGHANLIVLQPGDLLRLNAMKDYMEKSQWERLHHDTLREADQLVGLLLPEASANMLLAVASPTKYPDADAPALTPLFLAGGGYAKGSLLTSNTTRRAGLVANYDLAPTLVQFLGGHPNAPGFMGQVAVSANEATEVGEWPSWLMSLAHWKASHTANAAITSGLTANAHEALPRLVDHLTVNSQARTKLVHPWVNLWIGLVALIAVAELFRHRLRRYLRPLAETMLIVPLAWLFVPFYEPDSVQETAWYTLLVTAAIGVVLLSIRDRITRIGFLAGLTSFVLIGDTLLGAPLLKHAVLSYDPIAGARYYGIGNEYMGVLLGALLLVLNTIYRKQAAVSFQGKAVALALFTLVTYLFAAPSLGTNAGGALAAAVGFTYALLHYSSVRFKARHWWGISGAVILMVLAVIGLNVFLPSSEQTHIGRAASLLFSGQFTDVFQIVARKMELNFLLLRVSPWGKLFLLLLTVLLIRRVQSMLRDETPDPFFARNTSLVLTAALAAFLFNDSGVVAAALTLLYAVVPIIDSDLHNYPVEAEAQLAGPTGQY